MRLFNRQVASSGKAIKVIRIIKILGFCTVTLITGACSILPRSGPDDGRIAQAASVKVAADDVTLGYDYALVDISKAILPFITTDDTSSFTTFGTSGNAAPEIRLGVGDVVQITMFESQSGGLFIPREAGARPGNFVQLPAQEIDRNGQISVPYAGSLRAAGQTPASLEENIQMRLQERAIEPQVTLEVLEQNFSRASVLGEVGAAGSFTIRKSGDRILDLIAQAGGITSNASVTFVTLARGGNSVKIAYDALTSSPRENIYVAPGDTINVTEEDKTFFVFGATGRVGSFDFGSSTLDLNAAVAMATGLSDNQADPGQVLVYRLEDRNALQDMGMSLEKFDSYESDIPTIYRANFRKPDSFFMAADFEMRDGDVIYVSNANSVEISKFFGIVTTATSGTVTVDGDLDSLSN